MYDLEHELTKQQLSIRGISLMIGAFRQSEVKDNINYDKTDYRESWRHCIDVLHCLEQLTQAIDCNIGDIIDRCNTKMMQAGIELIDEGS